MKTKLLIPVLAGMVFFSSFAKDTKHKTATVLKKHQTSGDLGYAAKAPDGRFFEMYGTSGTGPNGVDEYTGALEISTGISYVASGHSTAADYVVAVVYNSNGYIFEHINSPELLQ